MRLIDVPLAQFGGLVVVQPKMDAQRDLAVLQHIGEIELSRRVVSRIAAENYQQIHLAGLHIRDEIFNRIALVDRIGIHRIGVRYSLADVAEALIDNVRERVHRWRLMIAGQHQARPFVALQVPHHGGDVISCLAARNSGTAFHAASISDACIGSR